MMLKLEPYTKRIIILNHVKPEGDNPALIGVTVTIGKGISDKSVKCVCSQKRGPYFALAWMLLEKIAVFFHICFRIISNPKRLPQVYNSKQSKRDMQGGIGIIPSKPLSGMCWSSHHQEQDCYA